MSRSQTARIIDVMEVPKKALLKAAGENWGALVASGTFEMKQAEYWNFNVIQQDRPTWTPPLDRQNKPVPFLSLNHAWLREIDGRAFLYAQNW